MGIHIKSIWQWPFDDSDINLIRSKFKKLNNKNQKIQLARKILYKNLEEKKLKNCIK